MIMGAAKVTMLAATLLAVSVRAETAPTIDGGTDAPVIYDCPQSEERPVQMDGGWFLTTGRAERLKCLLTATQKHRDILAKQNDELRTQGPSPSWQSWALVVVVAAATGFTIGYLVKK